MDIPFLGATIGWRNYKIIAKAELKKVPILGKAICLGGHVLLDRSNLRSQLRTLKAGMQWLKVCDMIFANNSISLLKYTFFFINSIFHFNCCNASKGWSASLHFP